LPPPPEKTGDRFVPLVEKVVDEETAFYDDPPKEDEPPPNIS